jgi:hypothetical protein
MGEEEMLHKARLLMKHRAQWNSLSWATNNTERLRFFQCRQEAKLTRFVGRFNRIGRRVSWSEHNSD